MGYRFFCVVVLGCTMSVFPRLSFAEGLGSDQQSASVEDFSASVIAANRLIDEHLPELRSVVDVLKKKTPKEYEKAVRDLAKSSQRLETQRRRDQLLYEIEVGLLKTQMRLDLVAARLQKSSRPELQEQLRQAIEEREALRIARMERHRDLASKRLELAQSDLEKWQRRLDDARAGSQKVIERDFEQVLRRAEQLRQRSAKKKEI